MSQKRLSEEIRSFWKTLHGMLNLNTDVLTSFHWASDLELSPLPGSLSEHDKDLYGYMTAKKKDKKERKIK